MKVMLDGTEYSVDVHDPALLWRSSNRVAKFCKWPKDGAKLFIKRTEPPATFVGWDMITALSQPAGKAKSLRQAPKVLGAGYSPSDGRYYYITEYIDGITLEERLQPENQPLVAQARFQMVRAVYDALYDINQHGYWYADLSIKNILVAARDRQWWLIDLDSCHSHRHGYSKAATANVGKEYLAWSDNIYANDRRALTSLNALEWALLAADALKGPGFRIRRIKQNDIKWQRSAQWYQEIGAVGEFEHLMNAVCKNQDSTSIWKAAGALRDKIAKVEKHRHRPSTLTLAARLKRFFSSTKPGE